MRKTKCTVLEQKWGTVSPPDTKIFIKAIAANPSHNNADAEGGPPEQRKAVAGRLQDERGFV